MTTTLSLHNVKCEGCASTLKKALLEEFGEVEVNLNVNPREITLNLEASKLPTLTKKLRSLGYPLTSDTLSPFQSVSTNAKSFVSCAIGKIDNARDKH